MNNGLIKPLTASQTRSGLFIHLSSFPKSVGDSILSTDEENRARSYRFELDRQKYRHARSFLRQVLSAHTGVPPLALSISPDRSGRPHLTGQSLDFNMSRTEGLAIVAVSKCRVGIDVELIRPIDEMDEILQDHFTAEERSCLDALTGRPRMTGFFRLWTAKEAITKATGEGLEAPLGQIGFQLDGARTIHAEGRGSYAPGRWWISALDIGPSHICTIATEAAPSAIQLIRSDSCKGTSDTNM
ncbi:MAG: 4'-phosphopantetheinyl transferase family protein [Parvularcula sp.]